MRKAQSERGFRSGGVELVGVAYRALDFVVAETNRQAEQLRPLNERLDSELRRVGDNSVS